MVACKLNLVGVDLAHGSDDALTTNVQHDVVGIDGGSSELWVGAWSNVGVTTNDGQVNAVRAHWLTRVRVDIALVMSIWVRHGIGMVVNVAGQVSIMVQMGIWVEMVIWVEVRIWVRDRCRWLSAAWSVGDDVVVRVAIIEDESASLIVAGQLGLVSVNLVHIGDDGFSSDLKDDLVWSDSGCSELWVSSWGHRDIAANKRQVDSVGASTLGRGVSVGGIVVVLW